jgi:hypothetical protein
MIIVHDLELAAEADDATGTVGGHSSDETPTTRYSPNLAARCSIFTCPTCNKS